MAVALRSNEPSIYIDGSDTVITHFRSGDAELLALVRDAADPAQVVGTCLTVGARAVRLTAPPPRRRWSRRDSPPSSIASSRA